MLKKATFLIVLAFAQQLFACVGANQIGMSGAGGEVLADNSSACYWNASLLKNLKQPEISYCHSFKNELAKVIVRYNEVFSCGMPIGTNKKIAIGGMYIYSDRTISNFEKIEVWEMTMFSVGIEAYRKAQTKILTGATIGLNHLRQPLSNVDKYFLGVDFGFAIIGESAIFKNDEFRLGGLYQGSSGNVRPSISETIPNFGDKGRLTGTVSIYDFFESGGMRHSRLGIRQSIDTTIGNIALETGVTKRQLSPSMDSKSFGLSYEPKSESYKISIARHNYLESRTTLLELSKRF